MYSYNTLVYEYISTCIHVCISVRVYECTNKPNDLE